jgi:hypothetical protein
LFWLGVLAVGVLGGILAYHALTPAPSEPPGDPGEGLTLVATVHPEGAQNHVHGIAYDAERDVLYIGTHHGLFLLANATEAAEDLYRVGDVRYDFMGLHHDPGAANGLYASGHTVGGNLGLIRSTDGGRLWSQLFHGVGDETVDFHAMSVSTADPQVIAGAYAGRLYVSENGGDDFRLGEAIMGGDCWGAPCLALDGRLRDALYRSDGAGLHVSHELGINWTVLEVGRHAGIYSHPADGTLWTWNAARGVLTYRFDDDGNATATARNGPSPQADSHVFQWSGHPAREDVLFAASLSATAAVTELFRTLDGGATWDRLLVA